MLRVWIAVAVLLSAVAAQAAGTLQRGNRYDPSSLDPHKFNAGYEQTVIQDLFEGLTAPGPDGAARPAVAQSWTVSPDGKAWTFILRPGLQWSDGVPLTTDDVVFSLRRLVDPKTAAVYASFIYFIKNAKAVNTSALPLTALGVAAPRSDTVVITLDTPAPFFPDLLATAFMAIVPRHAIEADGDAWMRHEHVVSNGAFVLKSWVPHDHIEIVRNPHFREADQVTLDGVMYYPTEDVDSAVTRFRAGGLDMQRQIASTQVAHLRRERPRELHITPSLQTYYLTLNLQRPKLADIRIRRALSLAIDRELIADRVLRAGQAATQSFVPATMPGYRPPDAIVAPMADRLAEAKALMTAAGYGPDHPLRLTYSTSTSSEAKRLAVATAAMWKPLGVELAIEGDEGKFLFSNLRIGDFDLGMIAWSADYPDPDTFLSVLATGAVSNYGHYANPAYDALLARAAALTDAAARITVLREAETLMLADQPIIPLYVDSYRDLIGENVHGWVANPIDIHLSRYLSVDRAAPPPR